MTQKELINKTLAIREKIKELELSADKLRAEERQILSNYTEENRKFKNGDAVYYTIEKYKSPRKYYVTDCFSYIDKNNDGTRFCKILYKVQSKNGYSPNQGWMIEEKNLDKAE